MLPFYRKTFLLIFTLFFVVTAPFLVFYSLGYYDFDLQNQSLSSSLTIQLDTFPKNALVSNRGKNVLRTPGELKGKSNQIISLEIKHEDYVEENLQFLALEKNNVTAKVNNLWLLPKKPVELSSIDEQGKFLAILSENLVLYEQNQKWFVQNYSFSGLQGKKFEVKGMPYRSIENKKWETLLGNSFWQPEEKILLFKYLDNWNLLDLNQYPWGIKSLVKISDTQVLALDEFQNLWVIDLLSKNFTFLESNVDGLTYSDLPDSIWLWKGNTIYRLERGVVTVETFILEDKIFGKMQFLEELSKDKNNYSKPILAKSVFQGIFFKINNYGFYVEDFNQNNWQTISNNIQTIGTDGSSVFWLDNQQNLYGYSLFLKSEVFFGKIDLKGDKNMWEIGYFNAWNRLLIYSQNQVFSVWYDRELLNHSVWKYDTNLWIDNSNCFTKVMDRFQFCFNGDKFFSYKNNSFFL